MEIKIKAIHFDTAEKLENFIEKKADKLARRYPALASIDFTLKVVKPESALNKQAIVRAVALGEDELVADKTADTFEEAVDLALEAIDRQLEKNKGKR